MKGRWEGRNKREGRIKIEREGEGGKKREERREEGWRGRHGRLSSRGLEKSLALEVDGKGKTKEKKEKKIQEQIMALRGNTQNKDPVKKKKKKR